MTPEKAQKLKLPAKEALMLWIMVAANAKFDPLSCTSACDILIAIATDYNIARRKSNKGAKEWYWDHLTPAVALQFASQPFPKVAADLDTSSAGPPHAAYYHAVSNDFQNTAPSIPATPWPGSGDHPRVEEVMGALGLK